MSIYSLCPHDIGRLSKLILPSFWFNSTQDVREAGAHIWFVLRSHSHDTSLLGTTFTGWNGIMG
jgi:hypothetical protein